MMVMTTELLERIDRHLQQLVALGADSAADDKTQTQRVERLAALGLDTKVIAEATMIPHTAVGPIVSKFNKNPVK